MSSAGGSLAHLMHRAGLLELLRAYGSSGPLPPSERESLVRIESFVKREPRCFERSLPEGHITASAWILSHDGSRCLLHHHRKLGMWLQLGGHVDGQADVLAAALREAREESGIERLAPVFGAVFDLDVHLIPERLSEPAHVHYDVRFLLRAPRDSELQISEESLELAWVPVDEVRRHHVDGSVLRMAEKGRAHGAASSPSPVSSFS